MNILNTKYGFTENQAFAILFEQDDDNDLKLTLDQFKGIIRNLYNIGVNDLPYRVNEFKTCDSGNQGFVSFENIFDLYHFVIEAEYRLSVGECARYIKDLIKIYGNGKVFLSFFEFINFVKEIIDVIVKPST